MNELTFTTEQNTATDLFSWDFSIRLAEYDHEQERFAYDWTITRDDVVLATSYPNWDSKLRCGCRSQYDNPAPLAEMLETLFSFLSAWSEAMEYTDRTGRDSENVDLFDSRLVPLLDAFSGDELSMFGDEIRGDA